MFFINIFFFPVTSKGGCPSVSACINQRYLENRSRYWLFVLFSCVIRRVLQKDLWHFVLFKILITSKNMSILQLIQKLRKIIFPRSRKFLHKRINFKNVIFAIHTCAGMYRGRRERKKSKNIEVVVRSVRHPKKYWQHNPRRWRKWPRESVWNAPYILYVSEYIDQPDQDIELY